MKNGLRPWVCCSGHIFVKKKSLLHIFILKSLSLPLKCQVFKKNGFSCAQGKYKIRPSTM